VLQEDELTDQSHRPDEQEHQETAAQKGGGVGGHGGGGQEERLANLMYAALPLIVTP